MRTFLIALTITLAFTAFCIYGAFASPCEWRCKVRATVCRADAPARCHDEDLHPDADTGLCVMLMQQTAIGWIVEEGKKGRGWTLKGAACVAPDDEHL